MHDLDRTMESFETDPDAFDGEAFEDDFEPEFQNELEAEFEAESEAEFEDEFESEFESLADGEADGPFDEGEEMELAAELLNVSDDEELEQFLGKLIRRVGRRARKVRRRIRRISRPLRKVLRPIAKRLLPIAGGAAGTFFGGPLGAAIGSRGGALAGKIFGLELEGMSPEDQEFEASRRFIRLASAAATQAAGAPSGSSPNSAAKAAIRSAATTHAPGLLKRPGSSRRGSSKISGRARSGRWIRRGGRIVLLGV